jgi:hypothetical protein
MTHADDELVSLRHRKTDRKNGQPHDQVAVNSGNNIV